MIQRLRQKIASWHINPLRGLRYGWFRFGNWRRGRFKELDYILMVLPATMPALPESRGWLRKRIFGAPPTSLVDLDRYFRQIAADPRPQGAYLH